MKPKTATIATTLIIAALTGLTIARAQESPPVMPDGMPMMEAPGGEAAGSPNQMTPDDEVMGQMGMMGMMMMMMMQQMSEMMELCMPMMRLMMEAPPDGTGGKP